MLVFCCTPFWDGMGLHPLHSALWIRLSDLDPLEVLRELLANLCVFCGLLNIRQIFREQANDITCIRNLKTCLVEIIDLLIINRSYKIILFIVPCKSATNLNGVLQWLITFILAGGK